LLERENGVRIDGTSAKENLRVSIYKMIKWAKFIKKHPDKIWGKKEFNL